jgi:hypothetical protein
MANFTYAAGESGDLFGAAPKPGRERSIKSGAVPELTNARVLCRQLRRKAARPEKQRIAHLICLNLLSMLRHEAPAFVLP